MAARPKAADEDTVDGAVAPPMYSVQSHLLHDGTPCIPGDTVPGSMFTAEQAAYLVGCGTLVHIEPGPRRNRAPSQD